MENLFFYSNVTHYDQASGITKKVASQIETFRKFNYNVYYCGYTEDGVAIYDNNDKVIKKLEYDTNKKINRYLRRWFLIKLVTEFIDESSINFNVGYIRFHFFDKAFNKMMRTFKQNNAKVVLEAHSYPIRERRLSKYSLTHIVDYFYESEGIEHIDLVAALTKEDEIWSTKTVQIDNAINLDKIPMQKKKPGDDNTVRLISVCNEAHYHGFNKVIKGVRKYYDLGGVINIQIYFVGRYMNKTKKLVETLNLSDHVHFLGKKYGKDLYDIYNKSDLGIGALGNRAGAEYGSTIKTKEYFAIGIPFINGWKEFSFDDSYPYVYRIDIEDEIDFFEILKFYNKIKKDKNISHKMRAYAKENFSWDKQIRKVIEALKTQETQEY